MVSKRWTGRFYLQDFSAEATTEGSWWLCQYRRRVRYDTMLRLALVVGVWAFVPIFGAGGAVLAKVGGNSTEWGALANYFAGVLSALALAVASIALTQLKPPWPLISPWLESREHKQLSLRRVLEAVGRENHSMQGRIQAALQSNALAQLGSENRYRDKEGPEKEAVVCADIAVVFRDE